LEHLRGVEDEREALRCVHGLLGLDDTAALGQGFRLFLRRFFKKKGSEPALLHLLGMAAGVSLEVFPSVEGVLWADPRIPDEALRRSIPVFNPSADSGAARRSKRLLPAASLEEVRSLAVKRRYFDLCRLLGRLAIEGLREAAAENPSFARSSMTLEALAAGASDQDLLEKLGRDHLRAVAVFLGAFLAQAIRGRAARNEYDAAGGDREKLLDLLKVDSECLEPWQVRELARVLEAEALLPLAKSEDRFVKKNARLLLAAIDPEKHLEAAMEHLEEEVRGRGATRDLEETPALAALDAAGDEVLLPLARALSRRPTPERGRLLVRAMERLGTERARDLFDRLFDPLSVDLGLGEEVLDLLPACGSPALVRRAIERIQAGRFSFAAAEVPPDSGDVVEEIRLALEVQEVPGRAEHLVTTEVMARLLSDYRARNPAEEDEDDEGEDGWDAEEAGYGPEEGLSPPGRGDGKTGRNDPCPCGSGKKYKKCCGSRQGRRGGPALP